MAKFPELKTGAVAQYPATKTIRFQNQTLRFVDGTQQRYRDSAGARRRWEVQLDRLDDSERAGIESFFEDLQGAYDTFTFTDPRDGQEYANCSLEGDVLTSSALAEARGRTRLVVVENR
ncbi:MAG TPA: DUF2460 domain-containing protein [Bryobacteraceae bacterium]|jgi:hypothetical protein